MKPRSLLLFVLMAFVLGGCARTIPPEHQPVPTPPTTVTQTVEGNFLIATRTLPRDTIDGVIKAVFGYLGEDLRIKGTVEVG
jgi:PBP1b-binding outer membrane lipoprotein LpoB